MYVEMFGIVSCELAFLFYSVQYFEVIVSVMSLIYLFLKNRMVLLGKPEII